MRNFQRRKRKRIKRETPAERLLEKKLKKNLKEINFIKQYPLGPYIADFYFPDLKIVVEANGKQHYTKKGMKHDAERNEYMKKLGIKTLRFSNEDIKENTQEVLFKIAEIVCKNLIQ